MASQSQSHPEIFANLCEEFAGTPGVTLPDSGRGFGSSAIKINNSIFAMLVNDRLVVKLPRARVTELTEAGTGEPFDAGKGKPMKEWVSLIGDEDTCRMLVAEALAFVRR
jgi:TfoX/Sxy family transcriptional regulator of competence genes